LVHETAKPHTAPLCSALLAQDRTEWIKQHKLRCEAMDCLLPYSPYLLATEDDFDVKA
jgi:hypothetical protein